VVEFGDGLAAGKRHGVRIGLPIGHAITLDEVVEREPVAIGPRVVLTEAWLLLHRHAERRSEDLGGLDRPRERARVQDVGGNLAGLRQPVAQPGCLLTAEFGQPAARARPADHAIDGDAGLAVPDEHEASRRGVSDEVAHRFLFLE
jgi:hypothetical protein